MPPPPRGAHRGLALLAHAAVASALRAGINLSSLEAVPARKAEAVPARKAEAVRAKGPGRRSASSRGDSEAEKDSEDEFELEPGRMSTEVMRESSLGGVTGWPGQNMPGSMFNRFFDPKRSLRTAGMKKNPRRKPKVANAPNAKATLVFVDPVSTEDSPPPSRGAKRKPAVVAFEEPAPAKRSRWAAKEDAGTMESSAADFVPPMYFPDPFAALPKSLLDHASNAHATSLGAEAHRKKPLHKTIPCKFTAGCTNLTCATSTTFCEQHVGSVLFCIFPDCRRAAENAAQLCRMHSQPPKDPVYKKPTLKSLEQGVPKTKVIKICSFDGCERAQRGVTPYCILHGGGKRCQFFNCSRSARGATSFCVTHGGGRRCEATNCTKSAVGATLYCISHGGGRRCKYTDCTRSAEGATSFCIRHGGGRRCKTEGCNKSAVGATDYCVGCGGGRRCVMDNCQRSAVAASNLCKGHGGGRRCIHPDGCSRAAQGVSMLCYAHFSAQAKLAQKDKE